MPITVERATAKPHADMQRLIMDKFIHNVFLLHIKGASTVALLLTVTEICEVSEGQAQASSKRLII